MDNKCFQREDFASTDNKILPKRRQLLKNLLLESNSFLCKLAPIQKRGKNETFERLSNHLRKEIN